MVARHGLRVPTSKQRAAADTRQDWAASRATARGRPTSLVAPRAWPKLSKVIVDAKSAVSEPTAD
jgi:hypothetical protein